MNEPKIRSMPDGFRKWIGETVDVAVSPMQAEQVWIGMHEWIAPPTCEREDGFPDSWLKRHGLTWDDEAEEWSCLLPATGGKIYPLRYKDGCWFIGTRPLTPSEPVTGEEASQPITTEWLKSIGFDSTMNDTYWAIETLPGLYLTWSTWESEQCFRLGGLIWMDGNTRGNAIQLLALLCPDDFADKAAEIFAGVASTPQVVIEGRGQAVGNAGEGWYWIMGDLPLHVSYLHSNNQFLNRCRYVKTEAPTFPPRPAFAAPPKPEPPPQVWIRPKGCDPVWAYKCGDEYRVPFGSKAIVWKADEVEILDDEGQVIPCK